jgi:transposase
MPQGKLSLFSNVKGQRDQSYIQQSFPETENTVITSFFSDVFYFYSQWHCHTCL